MKAFPPYWKNFIVFLFAIFTSTSFAQGNTCGAATSLTINGSCLTSTSNNITNAIQDSPNIGTCPGTFAREGWYTFTVIGGPLNVTITAEADNRNLFLQLISSSSSCSGLSQIDCANNIDTNGTQTETITSILNNGIYYVKVVNVGSNNMQLNSICVTGTTPCTGTPVAGTTTVSPSSGTSGSSYTVSATGYTLGSGITYLWQYSTDGGTTWTNQGTASNTYANYTATAPASGTVIWRLRVRCTNSGVNSFSTTDTFAVITPLTVPSTGNNSYTLCSGTLYDSGGSGGVYANSSDGYTVLNPTAGNLIRLSGSITSEAGYDYLTIYDGVGIGGTILWGGSAHGSGTTCTTFTVPTITSTTGALTVRFYSDGSTNCNGFALNISCIAKPSCSGTPAAGSVTTTPTSGATGSTYTVSATGFTNATGITYQWQSNTNGAGWVNVGSSSSTYSNYTATAPLTIGTTVAWQLITTCAISGQSATSTNSTFTVVNTLTIPITGSNTVSCGNNITLYDNGGSTGDYASNSTGYTVLEAGLGATITINGNYSTESGLDYIRIYNGIGTAGTLLTSYTGTGTISYTGTAGQTLTIQFYSDGSLVNSGFNLSISYSGVCYPACSGTPTGGSVTTTPNTGWPGSSYTVIATGYTQALNMSYQWQFSLDAGNTWTNAGSATSSYSNYNAIAPASGNVEWQLIVTCTNSGQSSISSAGVFVTMAVSDVVTGCPNVVSGGLGLSGADPAPFNCTATTTCVDLEATYLDLGNTTSYIIEPIAYNPPIPFTGLANSTGLQDDDKFSPVIGLPFNFCFYGNTYTSCVIHPNGMIVFGQDALANQPGGYSIGANLPSTAGSLKANAIFGAFLDVLPPGSSLSVLGGEIGWELITLSTGCKALAVSWSGVSMYSCTSTPYSGMMVLYENSNIIEVYIKEKNYCSFNDGDAIIGIQNADATIATVAPGRNGLDPDWTTANEAWRFVPNGTSIASIAWYEGATASGPVIGTTDILNVCPTATTTYTAEITYTLCDGRTIKETDTTTVTVNGAKTWNGSVNTDWNVANNWTPVGIPTALDCVVIPDTANDPIISGTNYNGLGLNLTIQNNANLTVTTNNDLTITDWININTSGDLILQNSASLLQINNDVNQGTMHMTRTANIRKLDYVYWSSPVSNFSINNVSPVTTGYKYKWIPTIPSNTNGFGNWTGANENMVLGKGYIVRGPDNFTSTITPFNAVFAGTPNNGTLTAPITRGGYVGANYTAASGTLATEYDDNWNLIGNPYPSAINAIDFLTLNTNINGFINIWTHGTLPNSANADPFYNDYAYNYTSADYITYNSSGASTGPGTFGGFIGAGQGFFVLMNNLATSATENITFNNTMRSNSFDNSQFFRSSNESGSIWVDLIESNGNSVRSLIAYKEGATNFKDRLFDAIGSEKLNFNIFSTIGNEIMKIQGRTLPFDSEDRVPLGIKVPQNGNYTIGIGAVDGFFTNENQEIYLEDMENNTIHNLRETPYNFSSNAGNFSNRFVLRYTNETLSNDDLIADEANLWVISSDALTVKSTKNTIQSVRVFDVLGRHLAYYPNVNSYEVPLTNIHKNNTGLLIQVTLTNGTIINKKAIY